MANDQTSTATPSSFDAGKYLKRSFAKCLIVSLIISVILMLSLSIESGVAFMCASLFGTLNWIALALIVIGFTEKKLQHFFGGVALKFFALGCFFLLVLPALVSNIAQLLIGFSLYLILVVVETLGYLISRHLSATEPSRPLPGLSGWGQSLNKNRNVEDA